MKKSVFVLFLIIGLNFNFVYSQSDGPRASEDYLMTPSWEYYSDNMLSTISAGKGNTGIAGFGDLSSLTLNPASVNINKKYQIFAGLTYKTVVDFPYNYHQSLKNNFPTCIIGGIYKINKNLQTGFVYRNDFAFKNEYILSSLTGENITSKFITHNFTVPVIYNYKWFSAGVNLNLIYFRGEVKGLISTELQPEGYYEETFANLWRFIPQFGATFSPRKEFSFGFTITPAFNDSTEWHRETFSNADLKSPVKYPWRLGVGTEVKLLKERLKLSFDYHFEKTSVINQLKDKSNFNFGVEYQIEDNFIVRGGFFTLRDFRDYSNYISVGDEIIYEQSFITLGGTYKYKGYSFSLALMDSHLTGNSSVSHTKLNGGISFDF